MDGLKLACSRELAFRRTFPSSVGVAGGVRGLRLEYFSKPLIPPFARSRNTTMAATANSVKNSSCGTNFTLRSGQRGVLLSKQSSSYRLPSRWDLATSGGVLSSQVHLRRLTQIERHLSSKEEVDTLIEAVKQGAKVVVEVADEVEKWSNIAEMKAEEVEKLAHEVEQVAEEVKKVVDDVADVLEGEKRASSLVDTYRNLKKEASATAAAAAVTARKVETMAPSGADDCGAATTITSQH